MRDDRENIYSLRLSEGMAVSHVYFCRVPGGWLVSGVTDKTMQSFVPYNEEFMTSFKVARRPTVLEFITKNRPLPKRVDSMLKKLYGNDVEDVDLISISSSDVLGCNGVDGYMAGL